MIDKLREALRATFFNTAKKVDKSKELTRSEISAAHNFAAGYSHCLLALGQEVPPIITINLLCGRVDRLFEEPDEKQIQSKRVSKAQEGRSI
jgi:hypothetical protein